MWYADATSALSAAAITITAGGISTAALEISSYAFGVYNGGSAIGWDANSSLPAHANGTSGNPSVSGVSTTSAVDLLLGFVVGAGAGTVTAGTGFTVLTGYKTAPVCAAEYQNVSSAQSSIAVGVTLSTASWIMVAAALTTPSSGTAVTADALMAIGILAGLAKDSGLPAESTAAQRGDASAELEDLAAALADRWLAFESAAAVRGDPAVPAENLGAVAVIENQMAPIESQALQRADGTVIFAGLATQRADGAVPAEALRRALSDASSPAESGAGQKRDAISPAEWTGALGVSLDSVVPLETTGRLLRDAAVTAEALGLAKVDLLLLAGILASARGDPVLGAEALVRAARDTNAPVESTGAVSVSVTADAAAALEFLARASIDPQALAEWTGDTAIAGDSFAPIEWLAIAPPQLLALGVGRLLRSPGRRRFLRPN
ncbi:MAG: hypothetical protein IVW56_09680 [Candidatus Binataceae bacterium]|nr:hypothetical protein [Candidatus Binataceae bacterium]